MTFKELHEQVSGHGETLTKWAEFADRDEFAPWVVECLRRAAYYAALSDEAIRECQLDFQETTAA